MKRFFRVLFFSILCAASVNAKSAQEIVKEMGAGWNLGNTLDACDDKSGKQLGLETETSWKMPTTTPAIFDAVKAAGFKTVRIPVSWHNHYSNGKINSEWMSRVKEIVDWAIEKDFYVVINIHHDTWNGNSAFWGYYPTAAYETASVEYVKNVWSQIAKTFADYDEHLVFETLNEPRLRGTKHEWWCNDYIQNGSCDSCVEAIEILKTLNQTAMDVIRASGGNNAERLVAVPSLIASPDCAFKYEFEIPKDSSNKTAVSVHMYTPYNFAIESPGSKVFSPEHKSALDYYFNRLNACLIAEEIPVFIGEFGATNKNNKKERIKWAKYFTQLARKNGISFCLWDNGQYAVSGTDYSEKFGSLDRKNLKWFDEDFIKAITSTK